MEEKTLSNSNNQQNIKNLIANILKKQLGKKLQNLEQKNDSEIKEIKYMSKLSKELSKNLNTYSIKVNKKISEHKYKANQNIRRYSPTNMSLKMDNDTNLRNNLLVKKSSTPIKNINIFMKKNNTRHRKDRNIDSKSIDTCRRNKYKYNDNFDNQSKYSAISNMTNKKKNKTPVRKKNKIFYKKISKTPESFLKKKSKIDFDMTSLDNDIEITKISINPDDNQERISNELYNITNTRLTICKTYHKTRSFSRKNRERKIINR